MVIALPFENLFNSAKSDCKLWGEGTMTRFTVFLCMLAIFGFSAPAFAAFVNPFGSHFEVETYAGSLSTDGTISIIGDAHASSANSAQFGEFTDGSAIGLSSGLVMSTGLTSQITSDNTGIDSSTWTFGFFDYAGMSSYTSGTVYDEAALEIYFTPQYNTVSFDYIFASEEYNTWVNEYVDLIVFLLTEVVWNGTEYVPIGSTENGAVIPGTDTAVGVNTVNLTTNSEYFVDNESPTHLISFDGFTTTDLTAEFKDLNPASIYSLTIAIADVTDYFIDSALFIEAGSLTSYDSIPVPEPATLLLLGTGLMGLAGYGKRMRK
jgi:hypothetical protein